MAAQILQNRSRHRQPAVPEGFADTRKPVYGMPGRRFDPQGGIQ